MNIPNKEDVLKKWAPILDNIGITGSQANWMSEYADMHSKNETVISNTKTEDFQTLLPISMKISAQTIGTDLVTVAPIGGGNSGDEMDAIRKEVKSENRDRKIDSLIENKEFEEMKVEDHPDYIKPKVPSGQLFYLDFKYGGTESNITI
jgi:hypothetical protein